MGLTLNVNLGELAMSSEFDAYHVWLGIPPEEQPPNHYRLLGLRAFESDPRVIENAADQRMTHLKTFQGGRHVDHSQRLLNEIATAKICLLSPARKAAYDQSLRAELYRQPLPRRSDAVRGGQAGEGETELESLLGDRPRTRPSARRKPGWQRQVMTFGITAAGMIVALLVWRGLVLPMSETTPRSESRVGQRPPSALSTVPSRERELAPDTGRQRPPHRSIEPAAASTSGNSTTPVFVEPGPSGLVEERLLVEAQSADLAADTVMETARDRQPLSAPNSSQPADVPPTAESAIAPQTTIITEPASPLQTASSDNAQAALKSGLRWLVSHQAANGSWSFQAEPNPGSFRNSMAPTALALWPMLRSGLADEDQYDEAVAKALAYLGRGINRGEVNGVLLADLRGEQEQGMYVHALGTIALCHAYAKNRRSRQLRETAQAAVNFIVYAQDPKGGGWRYRPREAGDTSVVGWQLTALAIARETKLKVPDQSFLGAAIFLDSVQTENGRTYGYDRSGNGTPATNAVGLLCRTLVGWNRKSQVLSDGVKSIAAHGPCDDVYYNFYATRLMRSWGGEEWQAWRIAMLQGVLDSQTKSGDAEGSWHTGSGFTRAYAGRHFVEEFTGRLGTTCFYLLILDLVAEDTLTASTEESKRRRPR